jgi:antitoxin (DNA-binding transcriptional repressor) of toxin-antitoxin stability system
MGKWQLQEAKARLSEVIKRAAKEGPQKITVHGASAAVVAQPTRWTLLLLSSIITLFFA